MRPETVGPFTRRQLLSRVGAAGGYGAAYVVMQGLGLLAPVQAYQGPPTLEGQHGKNISVLILGAGLAGMTAAYELRRAGYKCTIVEARHRAGGRNWTLRAGDTVNELGHPTQTCQFDTGLYFNPGPARIPGHHQALLGYCKQFDIPMEVFVNANRGAFFHEPQSFNGQPVQARRVHHDANGGIAELLAKAIKRDALDEELGVDDKDRVLSFLRRFGDLDNTHTYRGSSRAGYLTAPGAGSLKGEINPPLGLSALLDSSFWHWHMHFEKTFEQQATMLQPVGGMDRISTAFEKQLTGVFRFGAEVREIRQDTDQVRVVYVDRTTRQTHQESADYCICTIPLSVLARVDTDFSPSFHSAIDNSAYSPTCKLAWQAKRRFWEEDHAIYGGVSWTNQAVTQVWYPSSGFHAKTGILGGAYNFYPEAIGFGHTSPAIRESVAQKSLQALHPGVNNLLEHPISVAWQNIPYSEGGWVYWDEQGRERHYPVLNQPDGRVYLAGEHLSHLTAWQEGAVLSAHQVVENLHAKVSS